MARSKQTTRKGKQKHLKTKNESGLNPESTTAPDIDSNQEPPEKKATVESVVGKCRTAKGNVYFDVGDHQRISVKKQNGSLCIDMRQYYEKGCQLMAGKEGICLTFPQWEELKKVMPEIDEECEKIVMPSVICTEDSSQHQLQM